MVVAIVLKLSTIQNKKPKHLETHLLPVPTSQVQSEFKIFANNFHPTQKINQDSKQKPKIEHNSSKRQLYQVIPLIEGEWKGKISDRKVQVPVFES